MNSDKGKIWISIGLDDAELQRDIKKSQQAFRELGEQVKSECSQMDNAFSGISRSVASIGAAWSLQELGKKVATIRGEFQSLQKAMEVMLQSKSKAEVLMAQMVQTAATTPFSLQEVAGGAKQLLAYGLEAEKVNDTLIRLGDIASGLKIPLADLIYLYGTTMTQGRLYTHDLNQFTGRGIPMVKQLADHFGVAESRVRGLVEEGKVGFQEVQAVINNLTNEGGKFFNLMAEQSTLINGKISNLEDAFDSMFNEIGQNNEGVINDTLDLTKLLVENYKAVSDVLMTLVADYGVYKATLMAVTAYTNACYNYEIAQLKTVVAGKGAEIDADLASAVSKGRMTAQRAAEVQALRQEIVAKIEAVTVTERIAQAELMQARMKYESYQVTVSLSKMRVAQARQELAAAQASGNATAIESAQTNLNTAIKERNNIGRESSILKRNMEAATTNANAAAQARATLVTKADTAAKKINATTTSLLTLCTNGLTKAFKALKVALASNPFGIIMIAITTVIGALMTMNDTMSETSEEVERFGESVVKQSRSVETLLAVINNTSTKSKVHKDAVNELCKIYEDYGIKIDNERSKLDQLNQMRGEAIRLIKLEGEERQKANLIASYEEALNSANKDMRTTLQEALSNAEWDGSGTFDDWDYKKLQDDAMQVTTVIGSIMQDEAEELAKLTGDAYTQRLEAAGQRIQQAYKDLGYDIEKTFTKTDASGNPYTVAVGTDVGEIMILEQHVEKIRGFVQQRQRLIDSVNNNRSAVEEETEAVDYGKMSFDDLFNSAFTTKTDTSQQEALNELDKRVVTAIKTRKGTSDLLKEVNNVLETAEAGSDDEKSLLAIQKRLQEQQKNFKGNSNGDKTQAQTRANIERAEAETNKALEKASKERIALEKELYFEQEQNRINLEKDAAKRKEMQMRLDNEKEIYNLEKQRDAAVEAEIARQKAIFDAQEKEKKASDKNYVEKTFSASDVNKDEIAKIYVQYQTSFSQLMDLQKQREQEYKDEQTQAMNEYLAEYGSYLERRNAIIAMYDKRISEAETQGEKNTLTAKMNEELSELDLEANNTTSAIAKLFDDMKNKTVKDMRDIAAMGEEAMQFILSGEWDEQKGIQLGISKESFETIRKSPEKLEKIRKAIKEITDAADASDNAFNKMANGLEKIFKAGKNTNQLNEGLDLLESGLNDCLAVGGFLSDTLSSLGDAFGGGALSGIAEGLNVAMDAASSAMSGAKVGSMFGPIGSAIGGAIGLVSSLAGSFAALHDKKHEKRIQRIQDQIEVLEKNYDKLSRSIEKAYSKDASKLIEQQNTLLQQQKILIQQQIKEEEDKKKTDHDRIKEWKNQIEEIDQLIAENKEAAVDAIFGEDVNSAIDNFVEAYADAWASSEDRAQSAKDVVKSMMRQMVTESIKAAIQSSGKMEEIRKKLQQFYADNVLSGWEQDYIYNMAEQLQRELDAQFGWADSFMTDPTEEEETEREGVKKGIATASQESVDENNARLTTIQGHTFGIKADTEAIRKDIAASTENIREIRELSYAAVEHLADISRNTFELYETNRRLKSVEGSLEEINITIKKKL